MIHFRKILWIGLIEIAIGGSTILATLASLLLGINKKPFNVLLFVLASAVLSTLIGIGILTFKKIAYQLLFYFSSVVFLSKILILLGVIRLTGSLETAIPDSLKNFISICYHGFVLYYLQQESIKKIFYRE